MVRLWRRRCTCIHKHAFTSNEQIEQVLYMDTSQIECSLYGEAIMSHEDCNKVVPVALGLVTVVRCYILVRHGLINNLMSGKEFLARTKEQEMMSRASCFRCAIFSLT